MAKLTVSVLWMTTSARRFGSKWCRRMRVVVAPIARAACTNSVSRSDEYLPADKSRERRHGDNRDREGRVEQVRPQHPHDGDGEHDRGNGEEEVHQAHQGPIHPPSEEAAGHAHRYAHRRRGKGRSDPDAEGDTAAGQQPAEDVAAEIVRAEPPRGRWRRHH